MIIPYHGNTPDTQNACFIAPSSDIIGEVFLAEDSSVWFNATLRGDICSITVGKRSNIQDNVVIHVNFDMPTIIGEEVTIGHGAIIHACTIEDGALIGMGAIILDGAVIGSQSLVAAGSLVPPGKQFPPQVLIMGSPATVIRPLTEKELAGLKKNADHYVGYGKNLTNTLVKPAAHQ